jgi:hypothetical protein
MDMRGRAVAGLVAVLVAVGLAGCGDGGSGSGSGGTDAAGRPLLPPSALGGGGGGGSAAQVKAAPAEGGATTADAMLAPARPIEYRLAEGAKAPATSAPAYKLVRDGDLSATDVAKALGLEADAAGDVEVEQGLGWFYAPQPDESVSSAPSSVACAPEVTGPEGACEAPPAPEPPAGVPTAAEAEARFRTVLDRLGVDADDGRVEGDDGENLFARSVRFTPSVDGRPVPGLETTVSYGGEGRVEYASGFSGRFEKLGDYPLVGLDVAFERFQQGGGGGGPRTMVAEQGTPIDPASGAAIDAGAAAGGGPVMTIEPQPAPAPVPLEPEIVELHGAKVVLSLVYPDCEDGEYVLVPTYSFTGEDGTELGLQPPPLAYPSLASPADDAAGADAEAAPCPGDEGGGGGTDEPAGKPEPATTITGGDAGTSSEGSTGSGSASVSGGGPGGGSATVEPTPPAPTPAPAPAPASQP